MASHFRAYTLYIAKKIEIGPNHNWGDFKGNDYDIDIFSDDSKLTLYN